MLHYSFILFFLKERNFLHVNGTNPKLETPLARFKWQIFLRASHDAEYIIFHLPVQVTACSFNSQLSVEKRHYVLKHFFFSLLFFFLSSSVSFLATCQISHRILSHSRPPSNLLPDSLFLEMSESALPQRHVFISGQRRRDSSISPDPQESTPRFSSPVVTEMHRTAQTPIIESFVIRCLAARILA